MRTGQLLERSNPSYLPEASFDKSPSGDAFKAGRQDSSSNSDKDSLSSPSLDVKLDEQINPNRVDTFSHSRNILNNEDYEIIDGNKMWISKTYYCIENKVHKYENLSESEDNWYRKNFDQQKERLASKLHFPTQMRKPKASVPFDEGEGSEGEESEEDPEEEKHSQVEEDHKSMEEHKQEDCKSLFFENCLRLKLYSLW